jgi:hypothetical protein
MAGREFGPMPDSSRATCAAPALRQGRSIVRWIRSPSAWRSRGRLPAIAGFHCKLRHPTRRPLRPVRVFRRLRAPRQPSDGADASPTSRGSR